MLPSAALMPPCAATVWERVGKSLVIQAVLRPPSARPNAARRPAPPAPLLLVYSWRCFLLPLRLRLYLYALLTQRRHRTCRCQHRTIWRRATPHSLMVDDGVALVLAKVLQESAGCDQNGSEQLAAAKARRRCRCKPRCRSTNRSLLGTLGLGRNDVAAGVLEGPACGGRTGDGAGQAQHGGQMFLSGEGEFKANSGRKTADDKDDEATAALCKTTLLVGWAGASGVSGDIQPSVGGALRHIGRQDASKSERRRARQECGDAYATDGWVVLRQTRPQCRMDVMEERRREIVDRGD